MSQPHDCICAICNRKMLSRQAVFTIAKERANHIEKIDDLSDVADRLRLELNTVRAALAEAQKALEKIRRIAPLYPALWSLHKDIDAALAAKGA